MTISKNAVGLPVKNPTKAYWQTPPLPISNHRSTPLLPPTSQYVIVGSGISGATIAYKLLQEQPAASITILEARTACSGATGRNGGHCRTGRYENFKNDVERHGKLEALKLEKLEEENVTNLAKFIREHGIDCDLREVETYDITKDMEEWEKIVAALKMRKEVFDENESEKLVKYRIWSAKEASERYLVPGAVGAVSFQAYVLSPYKFVCAVLSMCLDKGLNLQTNTPVVDVYPQGYYDTKNGNGVEKRKWVVSTECGDIIADNIILATNAYTAALYPPLADFIIPTRAQVAAIRPGSNIAGNPVLEKSCVIGCEKSIEYMQTRMEPSTGAGDIIFGGGRRISSTGEYNILDDSTIHREISSWLTSALQAEYFGSKNWGENGETVMEWTGIQGYTVDSQPIIGQAPGADRDDSGFWICAGFNGHGMALTFQSAEALVQMIMGREKEVDEWLPKCYRLSRVPTGW